MEREGLKPPPQMGADLQSTAFTNFLWTLEKQVLKIHYIV